MQAAFVRLILAALCMSVAATGLAQSPARMVRRTGPVTKLVERKPTAPQNTSAADPAPSEAQEPKPAPSIPKSPSLDGPSINFPDSAAAPPAASPKPISKPKPTATSPARTAARQFTAPRFGARATEGSKYADAAGALPQTADAAIRPIRLAPMAFREILPGVSTVAQLDAKWPSPSNDQTRLGNGHRIYLIEPYKQVDVLLKEGKVASITVYLNTPTPVEEVAAGFVPDGQRSVELPDENGLLLGVIYPERGVALGYAPETRQVERVLFEEIDHESFLLRAEQHMTLEPQLAIADVEFVLSRKPKHTGALWLAARIYRDAGKYSDALSKIEAALVEEPTNVWYRLTKAEILTDQGDYLQAKRICQRIATELSVVSDAPSREKRAKVERLLGDLVANGPERDFRQALEHHLATVKIIEPGLKDGNPAVRRAAKQILVEAYLGVANDIAWGNWQQKDRVVPKWLVEAHQTAEDLIDKEGGDEAVHLFVLRRALGASAGTQGKLDPVAWTKEAVKSAHHLVQASNDSWRRHRIEWELGLALYDALQADQARGYHDHALSNSALVVKYLESSAKHREQTPHEAYVLGRLYFRVGAIHAVDLEDHRTAIAWFDKAIPLLDRPLPATVMADIGRLGESFVSMGISYWEVGERENAVRLTEHGLGLIQQGVKDRVMPPEALGIPYTNLAFMYKDLGQADKAAEYAELAEKMDTQRR